MRRIVQDVVESVEIVELDETVYNIAVADDETYFANEILVHNCRTRTVIAEEGEKEVLSSVIPPSISGENDNNTQNTDSDNEPLRGETPRETKARLESIKGKQYQWDNRFHTKKNKNGNPFCFKDIPEEHQKLLMDLLEESNQEADRIGIPRIRGVVSSKVGSMMAIGDGRLEICPSKLTVVEVPEYGESQRVSISYEFFKGEDQIRASFWHEFGHHIHQQYNVTNVISYHNPQIEKWVEDAFTKPSKDGLKNTSATEYGRTLSVEYFAEHYCLIKMGRTDLVNSDIFKKYLNQRKIVLKDK